MICGICSEPATHYFATVGKGNQGRCAIHAAQFGYPQYLVELNPPRPALCQPAYLIQLWKGDGEKDEVAEIWPFEEELAEFWVRMASDCGEDAAEWLVGDAAYEPYQAQFLETPDLQVEVTRVTNLLLV